jgi:endonuclease-3
MTEKRATEILRILRGTYALPEWIKEELDPFETLVETIISQNTADRNTTRAFECLSKRFEMKPEALAEAETIEIEQCLKVAGLYKNKAKSIKQVSRKILEEFHGALESILDLPFEDARKTLLQFPGVGPKTTDVVLLFAAKQPTIPVDTHVNRVAKRLKFTPENADYETVRKNLQSLYNSRDYLAVHLLLIAHGRKFCKARRPICGECPLNMHCPSKGLWGSR